MIIAVMGAGVTTVFVKNTTPKVPAATGPEATASVTPSFEPTVAPTNSVEASKQLAARNGVKEAPKGRRVPLLPDSGVGDHPIGIALVALGGAFAVWVRRVTRA